MYSSSISYTLDNYKEKSIIGDLRRWQELYKVVYITHWQFYEIYNIVFEGHEIYNIVDS